MKIIQLFFSIFVLVMSNGIAQNNDYLYRKMPPLGIINVSAGAGLSYFFGDLQDGVRLSQIRYQAGLGLSYRLGERLSLRSEVRLYRVTASQVGTKRFENNLSFRADNPDFYLAGQFDFRRFTDFRLLNPYLFAGAGMTHMNPKANYQGVWYDLRPLQTEGVAYATTAPIFLVGLGVSFRLSNRLSAGIEICQNYSTSDYLDDVSGVYPNITGLSPLAQALSDRRPELGLPPNVAGNIRGNPKSKDAYSFLSFRASYVVGSRLLRIERRKLRCF